MVRAATGFRGDPKSSRQNRDPSGKPWRARILLTRRRNMPNRPHHFPKFFQLKTIQTGSGNGASSGPARQTRKSLFSRAISRLGFFCFKSGYRLIRANDRIVQLSLQSGKNWLLTK